MLALRLSPPIELETPKGRGWAIIWRDYGFDHDDLWTCIIAATKEIWTFRNQEVRSVSNVTFGVGQHEPVCSRSWHSECFSDLADKQPYDPA